MTDRAPPTFPPGASAEQILQTMLPLVVQAVSDSAAAATAAGTAVQAVEARLAALEAAVNGNSGRPASLESAVKENTSAIKELVALARKEDKSRENQQAWLRTLFPPSTVVLILTILAAAFGIKLSLPGGEMPSKSVEIQPDAP